MYSLISALNFFLSAEERSTHAYKNKFGFSLFVLLTHFIIIVICISFFTLAKKELQLNIPLETVSTSGQIFLHLIPTKDTLSYEYAVKTSDGYEKKRVRTELGSISYTKNTQEVPSVKINKVFFVFENERLRWLSSFLPEQETYTFYVSEGSLKKKVIVE